MKISILGTGALGIAIADLLYKNGHSILMWTKFEEERKILLEKRENEVTLPGIKIKEGIEITNDLMEIAEYSNIIINVLPFVAVSYAAEELKGLLTEDHILCSTTKGMDMQTFETSTQIFERVSGIKKLSALSGPSFAIEIAGGEPICLALASNDEDVANLIMKIFENKSITLEKTTDMIGVQLCGAVKNAVAIGSGMLHGMKAADSTQAAYLARGIKDMVKVITSLGGNENTVYSYAGMGDLILTCMSEKSRNFSCGKLLGEGKTLDQATEILSGKTVEGIKVIEAIYNYMKEKNISLDTIPKLYSIVFENDNIEKIKRV